MSLRLNLSPDRLALLDSRLRAEGLSRSAQPTIARRPDPAAPVDLTPQQRQMWVLDQLVDGVSPYVILGGLRMDGPLDVAVLAQACRTASQRHESLRTVFRDAGDGPRQLVLDHLDPRVTVCEHEPGDADAAVRRCQDAMALEPFDLACGPLLRVGILRFGPDDHAVVFGMHHIVSDLWSMGVLVREVMETYHRLVVRSPKPLAPLTIAYPDYSIWQASRDDDRSTDIAYWTSRLAGSDPETGLVTDRQRPAEKSYLGHSVAVEIPPAVSAGVRALAQQEGSTRFMVLASAFAAFLVLVGQNEEVVVGTPVAGRPVPELEGLIGYFVNTVALRLDASGDPTFRQLVARTTVTALEAFDHDQTPFERVVQALAPGRSLSRNPLFQAMFSFQNAPMPRWDQGDLRIRPIGVDALTAKFDIQLDLVEDGEALWGRLVYSTDLFTDERGHELVRQLGRVLRLAVAEPDRPLRDIDLLDLVTRRQVLDWGTGADPEPVGQEDLYDLVADSSARCPGQPAVVMSSGTTTFGAMLEHADSLAARLAGAGVVAGDVVGLVHETDTRFLEGMLACWRLGAAFTPMDPRWPDDRIDFVVRDCGIRVALGDRGPESCTVLPLDDPDVPAQPRTAPPRPTPDPGRPAYVIYTSGTSGQPKGAVVPHRALVSYVRNVPSRLGWGSPGASYALAQQAHTDSALATILTALTTGGTLRVLDRDESMDPVAVGAVLSQTDHAKLVPSHLMAVVAAAGPGPVWPRRGLVLGGEEIGADDLRHLCGERRGRGLVNHYGPTEATIAAVTGPVSDQDVSLGMLALGTPVPGMSARVLDGQGRLVPPGVVGELYLAGPQVCDGYVGRPELTAERFVPDSFGPQDAVAYRTGDRVWWDTAGRLRFAGRVDDQAKIRGHRVEPAEVEAAVLTVPHVASCCVCVRRGEGRGARLVAYVTSEPGGSRPTRREVVDAVARRLPEHMVPTDVVVLDALPLQGNGKVDRSALPWPVEADADPQTATPPGTLDQEAMAEAFEAVLGRRVRDANATFFDLGGDSIQALHLVSAARQAGFELTTRDIFAHQSVAALAAACPRSGTVVSIVHDQGSGIVDTWPVLERMRVAGTRIDGFTHRVLLHVPVGVDADDLRRALDAVVRHHRALAARLETGDDGWRLVVPEDAPTPVDLVVVDADAGDVLDEILAERVGAASAGLDPRQGRDVAAVLVRRAGGDRPLLALVVHHVVVDVVSWGVVVSDLRRAWQQISSGGEVSLAPVPVSLRTWAHALAAAAGTDEVSRHADRWRQIVGGAATVLGVPDVDAAVREQVSEVAPDLTARLLEVAVPEIGASIDELCLAALGAALSELVGTPTVGEVLVEVEGHGRDAAGLDTSRTVGWLTEVHPVLLPVGRLVAADVASFVDALRSAVGSVRVAADVGWTYGVLRYLGRDPGLVGVPDAQVVYNHLGRVAPRTEQGDWDVDTSRAAVLRDPAHGLAPRLTRALNLSTRVEGDEAPRIVAEWTWPAGSLSDVQADVLATAWMRALSRIAEVAASGEGEVRVPPAHLGERIGRAPRRRPMPLSFAQLNNVLQPAGIDSPHHDVVVATVLRAAPDHPDATVDVGALGRALVEVARRHEVLRTRVEEVDGQWRQQVVDEPTWSLRLVDASGCDPDSARSTVSAVIAGEQQVGFDMADGHPARSTVVRMPDGSHVLVMVLHHVVIDPWGYAQLQRDLADAYQRAVDGLDPRLPALPVSYLDFAVWQQDRLASGELDEHVAYWREVFEGLPAPPAFTAPEHQRRCPVDGFTLGFRLPEELTREVHEVSRRLGVTPFTLLMAAFDCLQSCYSGALDLSVAVPLAGRDRPETHGLVGYFINGIVVRTHAEWSNSFVDLVHLVREAFGQGREHQEAPLRLLFPGGQGLDPFRTMFNLISHQPFALDLGALVSEPLEDAGPDRDEAVIPEVVTAMRPLNLDLYLAMHERDGALNGLWLFSPEAIDSAVMGAMVEAFPRLVAAVVADPGAVLADLRDTLLAYQGEQ